MDYLYVVFAALAVLETGQALRCWKCQSQVDGKCADFFNETEIRTSSSHVFSSIDTQIPAESSCENFLSYQVTNQKAVCMKKVELVNGIRHYTRKCEFVHIELPVGECTKTAASYEDTYRNTHIKEEFCQYCDTEFCNGSDMPKTVMFWLALASTFTTLFLSY